MTASLCSLAAVALSSVVVFAQDPVTVDPVHYKLVLENAAVRVLSIDYPAGATSRMHQHPDAIVVDFARESATYTPAGVHNPTNIGTTPITGLVVEFKTAAPGKATLPASRPGLTLNVLAEGLRAMAYRSTASATFAEPAGTKHDFDQVVIALGPTQMALSIDGKPAKTTWARGDAEFIGRGVAHEAKNTGGKPVDMIIVAIK